MAFRWAISTRMKFTPRPPGTIFKDEWYAATGGNAADLEIEANRRYALNHPRRAFKTLKRWNDGPWIKNPQDEAKANPMDFALKWSASKFEGHLSYPYVPNVEKTLFLNCNAFVVAGTTSQLQHSLPALEMEYRTLQANCRPIRYTLVMPVLGVRKNLAQLLPDKKRSLF